MILGVPPRKPSEINMTKLLTRLTSHFCGGWWDDAVNLDPAPQTSFGNKGQWGERLQGPITVMNGGAPSTGIMTKPPCGHWYMGHGHPWLIHAPGVIPASLLSIGFMTSHSCNLGSCIMSLVNWYIFSPHLHPFLHTHTHTGLYWGGMYFRAILCPEVKPSLIPAWILFELIVAYLRFSARANQQLLTVSRADGVSLLDRSATCELTR